MKYNCETETKKNHSNVIQTKQTNKQSHTLTLHTETKQKQKNHGIKTKDKNNFKRLRDQKLHVKAIEC